MQTPLVKAKVQEELYKVCCKLYINLRASKCVCEGGGGLVAQLSVSDLQFTS